MQNKFNIGDRVCYKLYPDTCIGIISYITICGDDVIYNIFPSTEWIRVFSMGEKSSPIVEFERNLTAYV